MEEGVGEREGGGCRGGIGGRGGGVGTRTRDEGTGWPINKVQGGGGMGQRGPDSRGLLELESWATQGGELEWSDEKWKRGLKGRTS